METAAQPRTIEAEFAGGVTAYLFENYEGHWGIRFCNVPLRGWIGQEQPASLCDRTYPTHEEAIIAVEQHYGTRFRDSKTTPDW